MTSEQLHRILRRYHRGEEQGITAAELQRHFGTTSRAIRDAVNSLRAQGVPICSGDSGYFYAESRAELGRSVRHMSKRIRNIAGARNGLLVAMSRMAGDGGEAGDCQ